MRTIFIIASVAILLAALTGYLMFNKKHRDVAHEEFKRVEASQLLKDFSTNEINANEQYLDKVLEVTGIVSELQTNQTGETIIILTTEDPFYGVRCTMQKENNQITVGMPVTIKGICTGYLSDVVITRGVLINKP